MERIEITQKFVATSEAKGYLDYLKKKQIFKRAIDAYAFAATYAMKQNADISQPLTNRSNSLAEVFRLDEDVRLALEAGVHIVRKRNNQLEPKDSSEVLEIVTKYAEAGIQLLQKKWQDKTSTSQIQRDIWQMINE
ncbi:MAG: hypothetical protein KME09_22380 [Pleurocapsa minor HA4230-MV1]|jgi:hypothetical protein|nr:hypothetical protein [Pleurocapsa minor HA4230-MV1]